MVDTWVTLSISDALVSFEFGTLLDTLGVKVRFGPNVGNVMDWSLGTFWSILNMSDILVPFGHFGNFGHFWTFGPLVMTDILYVGQFEHFWLPWKP